MPINEYGGAGTLRRFKMVIDKKSKDRDKQLEFKFPEKNLTQTKATTTLVMKGQENRRKDHEHF